jgi:hypothetical protein
MRFTTLIRREANMAPALAGYRITELAKSVREKRFSEKRFSERPSAPVLYGRLSYT